MGDGLQSCTPGSCCQAQQKEACCCRPSSPCHPRRPCLLQVEHLLGLGLLHPRRLSQTGHSQCIHEPSQSTAQAGRLVYQLLKIPGIGHCGFRLLHKVTAAVAEVPRAPATQIETEEERKLGVPADSVQAVVQSGGPHWTALPRRPLSRRIGSSILGCKYQLRFLSVFMRSHRQLDFLLSTALRSRHSSRIHAKSVSFIAEIEVSWPSLGSCTWLQCLSVQPHSQTKLCKRRRPLVSAEGPHSPATASRPSLVPSGTYNVAWELWWHRCMQSCSVRDMKAVFTSLQCPSQLPGKDVAVAYVCGVGQGCPMLLHDLLKGIEDALPEAAVLPRLGGGGVQLQAVQHACRCSQCTGCSTLVKGKSGVPCSMQESGNGTRSAQLQLKNASVAVLHEVGGAVRPTVQSA